MSHKKTERNKKIFKDREDGMSYAKIGKKYGLSWTAVNNICLYMEVEEMRNEKDS